VMSEASAPNLSAIASAADLRRLTIVAGAIGVVGVVVSALLGHLLVGLFGLLGLGLGLLNAALLRRSAGRFATIEEPKKSKFAVGALGRLALITVLALLITMLTLPDGLGVLGGLAIFQLLLVVMALIPLLKELRESGAQP
jgi:ATP synthase I chain